MKEANLQNEKRSDGEQAPSSLAQKAPNTHQWTFRELFLDQLGIDLGELKPVSGHIPDQGHGLNKKTPHCDLTVSPRVLLTEWAGHGTQPTSRFCSWEEIRAVKSEAK